MRALLRVGLLSGAAGGAALSVFLATVARGPIDAALAIEESAQHDGGEHAEMFSRTVQQFGGAVGLLLYGIVLGVVFIIVLGATAQHLPARSALTKALQLGAIGFVTVVLVPFLTYPANPPGVGDPDTVNRRTIEYLVVLAASVLLTVLVLVLAARVRVHELRRVWGVVGVYGAGLVAILILMPSGDAAVEMPADVLWEFRLASVGGLAAGWLVMALTAGTLLTARARDGASDHRDGTPAYASIAR